MGHSTRKLSEAHPTRISYEWKFLPFQIKSLVGVNSELRAILVLIMLFRASVESQSFLFKCQCQKAQIQYKHVLYYDQNTQIKSSDNYFI